MKGWVAQYEGGGGGVGVGGYEINNETNERNKRHSFANVRCMIAQEILHTITWAQLTHKDGRKISSPTSLHKLPPFSSFLTHNLHRAYGLLC
jgi:hypothetical protein